MYNNKGMGYGMGLTIPSSDTTYESESPVTTDERPWWQRVLDIGEQAIERLPQGVFRMPPPTVPTYDPGITYYPYGGPDMSRIPPSPIPAESGLLLSLAGIGLLAFIATRR